MSALVAGARRAFWKSPHHAALALLTLGAGFATGEPLYFLAGVTAYVLGWVYLPDMAFFQRWRERRLAAETNAVAATELAQFSKRREAILASLNSQLRERYHLLGKVCRDIEAAADNQDIGLTSGTRMRKIDELMWMYLRLLSTQQSLEMFLETERSEDVRGSLAAAEKEAVSLEGGATRSEMQERLLSSRRERLAVLRKRLQRVEEADSNLALVKSEQERLSEQIKLIRADAVATKNAGALSARIDASVAQLNETNKWLSEMDQFRDLAGDLPMGDARFGFETAAAASAKPKERARESQ